ncbi:amidase family protein [Roseobacter sp. MH60115]|uniref:amidase family protein n=1 Tax=Roseobacter sp. MH60115 TaxID=2785324 RepID=UPI001E439FB4|nr:amidase family protein [Roseobacter sp. MH60115]
MITQAMGVIAPAFQAVSQTNAPRIRRLMVDARDEVLTACDDCFSDIEHDTTTLPLFDAAYDAALTIINAEHFAAFGALAAETDAIDGAVRARILDAGRVTAEEVARAETVRRAFTADLDAVLEDVDVLILPTLPAVPPTLEEARNMQAVVPLTRFVRPFNLSGHPAITLPILTAGGLPAGLQIVAARGNDAQLCAVAEWFAAQLHQIQEKRP